MYIVTFQPSWCHDHAHSSRPLFLKLLNFSLYMFWLFFSTSLSIEFNHSLCRSKQQTSNQLWMLLLHYRSMKISSLKQCFTEFIFSILCYTWIIERKYSFKVHSIGCFILCYRSICCFLKKKEKSIELTMTNLRPNENRF